MNNSNWIKGTGRIVYDPWRGSMKRKRDWWCVVNVDREITRYYRWWIERRYHVKGLCKPSWDAHISVIRGEKPRPHVIDLWKKYDRQIVEFEYQHFPHQNGDFWIVDVRSPFLMQIREEFGMPTHWNLHLTVGRTWFE